MNARSQHEDPVTASTVSAEPVSDRAMRHHASADPDPVPGGAATDPAGRQAQPKSPARQPSEGASAAERAAASSPGIPPSPYGKGGQLETPRVDRTRGIPAERGIRGEDSTAEPDLTGQARARDPLVADDDQSAPPGTVGSTSGADAGSGRIADTADTADTAGGTKPQPAGVTAVPRPGEEDGADHSLAAPTHVGHTSDPDWYPPEDPPMIRRRSSRPRMGWRGLAYNLSGGHWNPGQSPEEQRIRERERKISRHLRGKHVTAFFCLKGGISKTSTTAATSMAMSNLRPDPVFAIDANPDAGDLAERLVGQSHAGITELSRSIDSIGSLDDLSQFTVTAGRLTMLPGEPNPELGDSLSAQDFRRIMGVVQRYYNVVQVDCGTGVTHPLMRGILEFADTVVIPASWSITGAKRAAETISWLERHGFERLARTSIVVLTAKDIVSRSVDKEAVRSHLSQAAELIVVPSDSHMADGALIDWEQLAPSTKEAYLDIAAAITARFPVGGWPTGAADAS